MKLLIMVFMESGSGNVRCGQARLPGVIRHDRAGCASTGKRASRPKRRYAVDGVPGIAAGTLHSGAHRVCLILAALLAPCSVVSVRGAQDLQDTAAPAWEESGRRQEAKIPVQKPEPAAQGVLKSEQKQVSPYKLKYYIRSVTGPPAWLQAGAGAGLGQARDSTPEWGQGVEGYGRRFGSRFAQGALRRSIQQGLGAILHEDPRHFPSGKKGILARSASAVLNTFVIRRDDGRRKFADSRLVGAFGAGLISRTWYPDRQRTVVDGVRAGALSLASEAGWNILREFRPELRRLFGR